MKTEKFRRFHFDHNVDYVARVSICKCNKPETNTDPENDFHIRQAKHRHEEKINRFWQIRFRFDFDSTILMSRKFLRQIFVPKFENEQDEHAKQPNFCRTVDFL